LKQECLINYKGGLTVFSSRFRWNSI